MTMREYEAKPEGRLLRLVRADNSWTSAARPARGAQKVPRPISAWPFQVRRVSANGTLHATCAMKPAFTYDRYIEPYEAVMGWHTVFQ